MQINSISAFELLHKGILAFSRAEQIGIQVDVPYCEKTHKHLQRQIDFYNEEFADSELARRWKKVFGNKTNYNSDPQLANVLFKNMKIEPIKFTVNNNPAVDEDALMQLDMPDLNTILKIRHLTKVKDTYIGGFLIENVNGVIHCFFDLHIPRSFRSSSSSINFQNQPNRDPQLKKLCRRAIKARKNRKLLCADYGGIEVKISYTYHKDPTMRTYLLDDSTDMHRDTAMDCFLLTADQMTKPIRQSGKGDVVFPWFYGDYYRNSARALWKHAQLPTHNLKDGTPLLDHLKIKGIKTYEKFEKQIQKVEDIFWNKRFPVYKQWREDIWETYCKQGYIESYTGFRFGGYIMGKNDATNYPVQGAAFHCLLLAFIILDRIQDERNWKSRLIAQIHDELIIEMHPDEEKEVVSTVEWVMTKEVPRIFKWINIPLVVEMEVSPLDGTWYDKRVICTKCCKWIPKEKDGVKESGKDFCKCK